MKAILPDLPLFVVSEFPAPGGEWIPYHIKRSVRENLDLVRARLDGRPVRVSALVLQPRTPYWNMRLAAFLLAPLRVLSFNECLDHWMLRPANAPQIAAHIAWRVKTFIRVEARPGGFTYTWLWRFRHPHALRRPFAYRGALAAGAIARVIKRVAPVAAEPELGPALPDGISVVIPSRDGKELLRRALPAVIADLPTNAEVIIVDNGSTDATGEWLAREYPALAVEHSAEPLSFAAAVNRGIRRARYSHVCLLNNDMAIEPGFFGALRSAFDRIPELFCATAQIFFPEGQRREETGKAVMPLHRAWNAFPVRCDEPVTGENFSYVLYGSGGCSLYDTRKLRALGAIGEVFEPAYVEDLDVGFRAWRRGWPSVFVSGARVVHHHRTTTARYYSATDLALALERNYLRFLTRSIRDGRLYAELWREAVYRINVQALDAREYEDVLISACGAPGWIEEQPPAALPEREILAIGSGALAVFPGHPPRGKPVILVASPYAPFPLSHGGAVRMYNLMRAAATDFDQVLVHFTDSLQPAPKELLDICLEVVQVKRFGSHAPPSTERPDVVEEFDSPVFRAVLHQTMRKWRPSIAQLEFTQMAQYAGDCAPARTVLVEHDITLDLYAQLLQRREDWETRRQYERWVNFEKQFWARVDRVVTMSEKDRKTVSGPNAIVLANGVDIERFQPSPREPEPRRILFIGSFAHLPNVMALDFFLREVWPVLEPLRPTLHVIAGSRPEYFLERYADRVRPRLDQPRIELEAFVADVRPAYERATVVVAPLLASAGTNIKIMEAMAMGKAIVSTPAGVNGLDEIENGRDIIVVNTGEQMAYAIAGLFDDPETRREIERQARKTAVERYDWAVIAREQKTMYDGLLQQTSAGAGTSRP
jgi:GT2 family glycosyltransferase/glycosyltransferase involved in cell wall biosynthesis